MLSPARLVTRRRAKAHAAEEAPSPEGGAAESSGEELAGVDLESTSLIVLAVLAGLVLSAAAATELGRSRAFLLAVVVIALAWAVLDVRELLHQLDESRGGIAAIALAVAVLHLLGVGCRGSRCEPSGGFECLRLRRYSRDCSSQLEVSNLSERDKVHAHR